MRRNPSTSIPVRAISRLVSLVVVALAAAACDPPEQGEPPDPGPGAPEPSSPGDEADPSTRTIIHLSETESRAIVRGPLYDPYSTREGLDEAKHCLLRHGIDPKSVRIVRTHQDVDLQKHPVMYVETLHLLNGVPDTYAPDSLVCGRSRDPVHIRPTRVLRVADTEPKISFVEAAIVAFSVLRHSHSWLKTDDYTADLVILREGESPDVPDSGEPVLQWVIGRPEMQVAERVFVDASTGAVRRGGPTLVAPSIWHARCDAPAMRVCPAGAPPVCGLVDHGRRCPGRACYPSKEWVDFPDACVACASFRVTSYLTSKCDARPESAAGPSPSARHPDRGNSSRR